jgi:tRNA(fMet)-specific endonuclease VapC
MYLFDTDIITNILKKFPAPLLLERLSGTAKNVQHISTITIPS